MNIIRVTVVYALPEIQYIYNINVKPDSTVKDAILASNVLKLIKNTSFYNNSFGIYNKLVNLKSKLKNGDRIEIYRNLIIDPKEWRRKNISIKKNKKLYS